MTNQEISLKWNGFQHNILTNVKDLLKDEGLSDVTLVSGGQSFKAHKVILSANSSVFRAIFQQNPHKDPIIVLHEINTESLRVLLTFMYHGEVNVTEQFLPVLLKTADTLKVCGLSTGNEPITQDDEKLPVTQPINKKRKAVEPDENCHKVQKVSPKNAKSATVKPLTINNDLSKSANIVLKVEPIDSPLTDYSGENTNDTDLLFDECEKKYSVNPDNCSPKCLSKNSSSEKSVKKWINEVSSTQPCLNVAREKCLESEEDTIEIDKEVETVLQSGTVVESLSLPTENSVPIEPQTIKEKTYTSYASPSFPCPFCPRVYNSWGYRRRHLKSRHNTNKLSCKSCISVLESTGAWYRHATRTHNVPHEEARNSLVVMVEAHAVLTLTEPSVPNLLGHLDIPETDMENSNKNN